MHPLASALASGNCNEIYKTKTASKNQTPNTAQQDHSEAAREGPRQITPRETSTHHPHVEDESPQPTTPWPRFLSRRLGAGGQLLLQPADGPPCDVPCIFDEHELPFLRRPVFHQTAPDRIFAPVRTND